MKKICSQVTETLNFLTTSAKNLLYVSIFGYICEKYFNFCDNLMAGYTMNVPFIIIQNKNRSVFTKYKLLKYCCVFGQLMLANKLDADL